MLRRLAQSSTAVISAPDCETKASRPGRADDGAKLAFRPIPRHQQANAVRPQDAQQMRPGRIQHRLLQADAVPVAGLRQAGGHHDRRARAARAEFGDQARHGGRRRADHRQFRRLRQRRHVPVAAHPGHRVVFRIDRPQRAAEAARQQVAQHRGADAVRAGRGADHGHRLRAEQVIQVAYAHAAPAGNKEKGLSRAGAGAAHGKRLCPARNCRGTAAHSNPTASRARSAAAWRRPRPARRG